ncbi:phosphoribosylaminoimidazolesuccinocarboxamide synthase [Leptothoe kymatousa]|uniref:Phosphoribosylaminoimidazole-succinocarboxamide synthase n=1 Tax=Leptothoe kymatousa TAU-MAC 1615 TaxID=2364775 RepID=A0ABS5Y472_9CYAN|nr:phosphoribosylaminoimidazolesuccinocarboxamide synthase [Leptothoe kymatousa]MBT9312632.1 phosphoribosylaminoimidazolesuccinocarboxamide synthase [Leptothoe kymatousa TAU-MAC 1615]
MAERKKLYEGKAKILYATEDPNVLVSYFKDDATAFNAQKRGTIVNKGKINNAVSTHLFQLLEAEGIPTHWLQSPNEREMWVKPVTIVPLEVVVRNLAAGSLCRQTGLGLGTALTPPLVEFYYKKDELGDPLLTRDRIRAMAIASDEIVHQLDTLARRINQILIDFFNGCSITLVDFKLEFGTLTDGTLVLADEISPDTCRLWNQNETDIARRVMDKDRFRQDLGDVESGYQQVLDRILAHTN